MSQQPRKEVRTARDTALLIANAAKSGQVRSGQKYECWITGDLSTWEIIGDLDDFSEMVEKETDFRGMRDDKEQESRNHAKVCFVFKKVLFKGEINV